MYGKLFASMYDGTLRENWKALVVFQQMIVLSDADGVVDMTPSAIAARTGLPLDLINEGLGVLESPDPYSRTPDDEGRRIQRLDNHRPWGWSLTNHQKYKALQDSDTVREGNRERKRKQRERERVERECHGSSRSVTDSHGQSRHTDTDTKIPPNPPKRHESHKDTKPIPINGEYPADFELAWHAYPRRSGGNSKAQAFKAWKARRKAGVSVEEMVEGISRYAAYCDEHGKTGTEFVKQTSTFLGTGEHWKDLLEEAPGIPPGSYL